MRHDTDIIIVGAGLAGACAALSLSPSHSVRVYEAQVPGAGASGAAAGLVNPFLGRRARPVWQMREALSAVPALLNHAGASDLFRQHGVLRPVVEPEQETRFRDIADAHPDLATWLSPTEVHDHIPELRTESGALFVPKGGAIDVGEMVTRLLRTANGHGARVETEAPVVYWRETPSAAVVEVGRGPDTQDVKAELVLLALGQGYWPFPELRRLGLTRVKGQTVRVERPDECSNTLPPLSGRGYVVPDGDTLVLGSNYHHDFDDLAPDPEATTYIREKTARMMPGVDQSDILEVKAGVRVMHSETNLPLLGPLPERSRIWTFTGLGSKGLLTAPLLARSLPRYLQDPSEIPEVVRPSKDP